MGSFATFWVVLIGRGVVFVVDGCLCVLSHVADHDFMVPLVFYGFKIL